jgi:hypothetical protein
MRKVMDAEDKTLNEMCSAVSAEGFIEVWVYRR